MPLILLTVKLHCPSPSTLSPSSTILLLFWRLFLRQTSQPLWWQNEAHSSYWKLRKTQSGPYSPGLLPGAMALIPQFLGMGLLCRQALLHLLCEPSGPKRHRLRRKHQTPPCLKLAPCKGSQMQSVPPCRPPCCAQTFLHGQQSTRKSGLSGCHFCLFQQHPPAPFLGTEIYIEWTAQVKGTLYLPV